MQRRHREDRVPARATRLAFFLRRRFRRGTLSLLRCLSCHPLNAQCHIPRALHTPAYVMALFPDVVIVLVNKSGSRISAGVRPHVYGGARALSCRVGTTSLLKFGLSGNVHVPVTGQVYV